MRLTSILLVLMACLAPHAGAQSLWQAEPVLYLEWEQSRFDTTGLNGFFSSYNAYWGSDLASPWDEASGWEFSHANVGAGVRSWLSGPVNWSGGTGMLVGAGFWRPESEWQNGVQNRLRMRVIDWKWTAHAGIQLRERFFVEGYLGANARTSRFIYSTVHQDGSESISSEYKLNGVYEGLTASFDYGAQLTARFRGFNTYLRLSVASKSFPPGKGLVSVLDYDDNDSPPTDLPSDYELWATDPVAFTEQDLGVRTDSLEGLRITIGVEITPGSLLQ